VQTVLERPPSQPRPELVRRTGEAIRAQRVPYLDNLKLILVAVIIAGHGALAYGDLESAWPYQDVQEVQLTATADIMLSAVVVPAVLFVMGLFFLVSGHVTPGSVARKGPQKFARDRLVRLGLPLLVWTLVLWPGAIWISALAAGQSHSFWTELTTAEPILDTGPLWFVEVLLIYSLAYAAWRRWHPGTAIRPGSDGSDSLSGRTLVALAVGVSLATILVRPILPIASGQIGQSHLWQWPQFVAMFALGIIAAQRSWLDPVPDRIRRRCGYAAIGGVTAWGVLSGIVAIAGVDPDVVFDRGFHWASLTMAAIEGPLAVGASVWLLGLAQRRLNRRPGALGRALSRSAYGAFLLQGVVLIALMVALRPVPVAAEAKAVTVALLGVAGSFALAWFVVNRTRLGRIL
jgi:surface polysaccharide O-acyltransferase-like enzyme